MTKKRVYYYEFTMEVTVGGSRCVSVCGRLMLQMFQGVPFITPDDSWNRLQPLCNPNMFELVSIMDGKTKGNFFFHL